MRRFVRPLLHTVAALLGAALAASCSDSTHPPPLACTPRTDDAAASGQASVGDCLDEPLPSGGPVFVPGSATGGRLQTSAGGQTTVSGPGGAFGAGGSGDGGFGAAGFAGAPLGFGGFGDGGFATSGFASGGAIGFGGVMGSGGVMGFGGVLGFGGAVGFGGALGFGGSSIGSGGVTALGSGGFRNF